MQHNAEQREGREKKRKRQRREGEKRLSFPRR